MNKYKISRIIKIDINKTDFYYIPDQDYTNRVSNEAENRSIANLFLVELVYAERER